MTLLALAALLAAAPVRATFNDDAVKARTVEDLSAAPGTEFHALCRAALIGCGIEVRGGDDFKAEGKKPVFKHFNGTVEQAVERIIERHPLYEATYNDGVVNILPRSRRADDPLESYVGDVALDQEPLESAVAKVCGSANIDIEPPKPHAPRPGVSDRVSARIKRTTALSALNTIVRTHRFSVWYFRPASWALPATIGAASFEGTGQAKPRVQAPPTLPMGPPPPPLPAAPVSAPPSDAAQALPVKS